MLHSCIGSHRERERGGREETSHADDDNIVDDKVS